MDVSLDSSNVDFSSEKILNTRIISLPTTSNSISKRISKNSTYYTDQDGFIVVNDFNRTTKNEPVSKSDYEEMKLYRNIRHQTGWKNADREIKLNNSYLSYQLESKSRLGGSITQKESLQESELSSKYHDSMHKIAKFEMPCQVLHQSGTHESLSKVITCPSKEENFQFSENCSTINCTSNYQIDETVNHKFNCGVYMYTAEKYRSDSPNRHHLSPDGEKINEAQIPFISNSKCLNASSHNNDSFQLSHERVDYHTDYRKPHSTPATLFWLRSNFQLSEGACIPRCEVYCYYVDFCNISQHQPVNAASFGKVIRQMFPHLTTRRLGTRGKSRYHYYGLAVKKASIYYNSSNSRRGRNENL